MEEQGESQHDAEVGPPGGVTARSSADETLAGPYGLPSREKIKGQTAETTLYRQKTMLTCTVSQRSLIYYSFLLQHRWENRKLLCKRSLLTPLITNCDLFWPTQGLNMLLHTADRIQLSPPHGTIQSFTSNKYCSIFTESLLLGSPQGTSSLIGDDWRLAGRQREAGALV